MQDNLSLSLSLAAFLVWTKGNVTPIRFEQGKLQKLPDQRSNCSFCPPVGASLLNQMPTKAKDLVCPVILISLTLHFLVQG
jgi:hypothetical protein